ncbi:MAG: type II toxin-antitoxin system HigB family toxin [Pirellulales bacterium]
MRAISKSRLRQFWERPDCGGAEKPLRAWYTHVNSKSVVWQTWADVSSDFATASIVGNCIVFNIGGNKYRLITRVLYGSQKVFILKVMTHKEYDDDQWKEECGCYATPPRKVIKKPVKKLARPKRKRKGK